MTNVSLKLPDETCFVKIKSLLKENNNIQIKNFSGIGNGHYSYTVILSGEQEAVTVGTLLKAPISRGNVSVVSYTYGADYIGINILENAAASELCAQ